ncbi:MAG TPA: hypothetical protein VGO65_03905 [Pseudolysinimonas sp.]|nr:hypothetical protein [Pseudolysinimonas sp.]
MGVVAAIFSPARRAVIALASLLAMLELDRLVGETLGSDGQTFTIAQAVGPGAFGSMPAWGIWATAVPSPMPLIGIHVLLDVVFFVCYLSLLRQVDTTRPWRIGVRLLFAAEVLEDMMMMLETQRVGAGPAPADYIVAFAATAKWLFVLFLVVRAFGTPIRQRVVAHLRTARALIGVHRVAFVVLGAIAAVSLIPRAGVLEQLPDVQRSWITWDEAGRVGVDGGPILGAALVALLLAVSLMAIGRVRSRHFARLAGTSRSAPDRSTYIFWFVAPGVAVLVFAVLLAWSAGTYGDALRFVDLGPFLTFVIVTVLIGVVSLIWDRVRPPTAADTPFRVSPATTVAMVTAAGEVLASLSLTVAGLGMIRSFTAPMLLGLPEYVARGPEGLAGVSILSAVFAVLGLVLALLGVSGVFGWLIGILAAITPTPLAAPTAASAPVAPPAPLLPPAPEPPTRGERVLRWIMGVAALVFLASLSLFPLQLTHDMALATAVGIVVAWGTLLTVVESRLQEHRPLRVFGAVGMRSVPLLTLFIAIPLLVAQFGGPAALHAIQSGAKVAPGAVRPTLEQAFTRWAEAPGCTVTAPGGATYRPLVLVAAQGGGIRAATWTANVLRRLDSSGGCAPGSILLSSGASGGSVGLALLRGQDDGALVTTDSIGDEDGLAAGLAGTLIIDDFAAVTGLRVPSAPGYSENGRWTWQDRAALIQAAWAANSEALTRPYDAEYEPATGWLLLNSTAAGADCRAVISQLDLQIGVGGITDEDPTATCGSDTPSVSGMIDVQAYCDLDIDWATAAMLSARFPIVTPAGRITGVADHDAACRAIGDLQLADGGYSENSGLGTLSDLAPDLTALVRQYNAERGDAPPVVPFLLYARNEGGADVAAPDVKPASELLVPLLANGTKSALISDAAWLQRLSDDLQDVCTNDERCTDAVSASRRLVAGGVAVAAPRTEPAVISPLGWTLSDISRTQLRWAVASQVPRVCSGRDTAFAGFGDLLDALGSHPEGC